MMFKINVKVKKIHYELLDETSNVRGLKTVLCKKDVPSKEVSGTFHAFAGKEYEVVFRSSGAYIQIKPEPESVRYSWLGYGVDLRNNDAFYKKRYRKKPEKKEDVKN